MISSRASMLLAILLVTNTAHGQLLQRLFAPQWGQQPAQACVGPQCGTQPAYAQPMMAGQFTPQQQSYPRPMPAAATMQPTSFTAQHQQPASVSTTWGHPNPPSEQLPSEVQQAIVQIRGVGPTSADGRTESNVGSGVLIDRDEQTGLVVTCAHILEGATQLVVSFQNGQQFAGRLVASDKALDVSCIEIGAPSALPVELADADPQLGQVVRSYGYGGNNVLTGNEGRVVGYVALWGTSEPTILEISGACRMGDSGGPMLDTGCRLVGVSHGCDGRVVDGCRVGIVRRVLGRIRQRIRARHFARGRGPQQQTPQAGQPQGPWRPQQPATQRPAQQLPPQLAPGAARPQSQQVEPTPPLVELPPQPTAPPAAATQPPQLVDLAKQLEEERYNREQSEKAWAALARKKETDLAAANASLGDSAAVRDKLIQERQRLHDELERASQPPTDLIAKGVEGAASKAGQAWLTTVLVGIGLPAGPAGIAAGLLASAAIGFGGYKLRSWFGDRGHAKAAKRLGRLTGGGADEPATGKLVAEARRQVAEVVGKETGAPPPVPHIFNLSSAYADDLGEKRHHEGMTLGQEHLLAQLYKEGIIKLKEGHFADATDKALAIDHWVQGQFLSRHNVRTALNSGMSVS